MFSIISDKIIIFNWTSIIPIFYLKYNKHEKILFLPSLLSRFEFYLINLNLLQNIFYLLLNISSDSGYDLIYLKTSF